MIDFISKIHIDGLPLSFLIANGVVVVCTTIVIFAIFLDFILYHKPTGSKKKLNSRVETGTMFIYFFLYYLILKSELGRVIEGWGVIRDLLSFAGSIILIIGCYFNVKGRFILKESWANQVTIYHDHVLRNKDVYAVVRHPLYASIIWMLVGGSFIYCSYGALISVLVLFIPMMVYRARQEEVFLMEEFPEYSAYKLHTGMFFPKITNNGKL